MRPPLMAGVELKMLLSPSNVLWASSLNSFPVLTTYRPSVRVRAKILPSAMTAEVYSGGRRIAVLDRPSCPCLR